MAVVASVRVLEFCLQSLPLAGVGGQFLFDNVFWDPSSLSLLCLLRLKDWMNGVHQLFVELSGNTGAHWGWTTKPLDYSAEEATMLQPAAWAGDGIAFTEWARVRCLQFLTHSAFRVDGMEVARRGSSLGKEVKSPLPAGVDRDCTLPLLWWGPLSYCPALRSLRIFLHLLYPFLVSLGVLRSVSLGPGSTKCLDGIGLIAETACWGGSWRVSLPPGQST